MISLKAQHIIDIGACVGLFIDHSLAKFPQAKIYAFEPLPANVQLLQNKYRNDMRVEIFPQAVSNFNGTAPLYKKVYKQKLWGVLPRFRCDFAGNAGSSLNKNKSNVSSIIYENVEVIRFRDLFQNLGQDHIDILKIDSEGTEYDILQEVIDDGFYKHIDKIYYEDHTRKIPELIPARQQFIQQISKFGIEHKFFLQEDHLTYIPISNN